MKGTHTIHNIYSSMHQLSKNEEMLYFFTICDLYGFLASPHNMQKTDLQSAKGGLSSQS